MFYMQISNRLTNSLLITKTALWFMDKTSMGLKPMLQVSGLLKFNFVFPLLSLVAGRRSQ